MLKWWQKPSNGSAGEGGAFRPLYAWTTMQALASYLCEGPSYMIVIRLFNLNIKESTKTAGHFRNHREHLNGHLGYCDWNAAMVPWIHFCDKK